MVTLSDCDCRDNCGDGCGLLALSGDCNNCGDCHTSATFTANTPVELAAGDAVELSPSFANSSDFTVGQEGIQVLRAGTYMVVYTVHIPINHAVNSRFVLTLNGERIAASSLDVATEHDCSTNGFTMHAMVNAQAGSTLKLVTLSPVSIRPSSASNVFTLSLTRIP